MLSSPYPIPPVRGWKLAMVTAYLGAATAGAWSLAFPPATYTATTPAWVTLLWSLSLIAGGALCALGVAVSQYRLEWVASWGLAFGIAMYAVLSWDATLTTPASGTRAIMLTAFTAVVLARAILLSRIDRLARERRQVQTAVEEAP